MHLQFQHQPLQLLSSLGQGAYGTIYLARHLSNQLYAVKYLNAAHLTPQQRRIQQQEALLHLKCHSHPNVLTVYGVQEDKNMAYSWYMVLEYCRAGDLFEYICDGGIKRQATRRKLTVTQVAKEVFGKILDAVEHCHRKGVYHRDLKPENFLVIENDDHSIDIRLIDFGLATTEKFSMDRGCGSSFYMAPECQVPCQKVLECYNTAAVDVWSLGVVLVNLVCGQNPWHRADARRDACYRQYLRTPLESLMKNLPITRELATVLVQALDPNPNTRATLRELRRLVDDCIQFVQDESPLFTKDDGNEDNEDQDDNEDDENYEPGESPQTPTAEDAWTAEDMLLCDDPLCPVPVDTVEAKEISDAQMRVLFV